MGQKYYSILKNATLQINGITIACYIKEQEMYLNLGSFCRAWNLDMVDVLNNASVKEETIVVPINRAYVFQQDFWIESNELIEALTTRGRIKQVTKQLCENVIKDFPSLSSGY